MTHSDYISKGKDGVIRELRLNKFTGATEFVPVYGWVWECDKCGALFTDGITAGWHEATGPGHHVSFVQ